VDIDLVSLPSARSQAPRRTERPAQVEPVAPPKQAPPPPKPSKPEATEAVSLAPSKPTQVKRSLKKKTFNPSKAINQAIAELEKKVPESRPQSVVQAIDALRKKEAREAAKGNGTTQAGVSVGEMTKKRLELLDIYNAEIWNIIRTNWAFSKAMAGNQDNLEAIVNIKIMRDGEIRDIYFDMRTGVKHFDESVLKAIKKSNPLPPLPEGYLKPFYDVGLRFNLSEMQRRP